MQPLVFQPILKRAIWGGRKLGTELGKPIGEGDDYAESWEVSDLPGNESVVDSGPLAGRTLRDLMETHPDELLGVHSPCDRFPLLIKFLDAQRQLSVQVHPSADMAARRPEVTTGKAESWLVLDARPDARIYAGLKPGVDEPALRTAIKQEAVEEVLHSYSVRRGDCIFMAPGTVHALGGGLLVAEVQQPNDVTYRLYDWGRVGPDGRPRELHLELGIEATNFAAGPVNPITPRPAGEQSFRQVLVQSSYFCVDRYLGPADVSMEQTPRPHVLIGVEGSAQLRIGGESFDLSRGRTVVLPAAREPAQVECSDGAGVLDAYLPLQT